jgi:glycosyltransferase involved in cell wall biosynthesis
MSNISIYSDWIYPDQIGGAERTSLSFAHRLNESNNVTVFSLSSSLRSKTYEHQGLVIKRLSLLNLRRKGDCSSWLKVLEKVRILLDLITPFLVSRKISQEKPELIFLHNTDRMGPLFIPILKLQNRKSKIYRIYHDLGDTCLLRTRFKSGKKCEATCLRCIPKRNISRKTSFYVNGSIFVSNFVHKKLADNGFNMRNSIVRYPLPHLNAKKQFSRINSSNNITIGYVGNISEPKGIKVLLDALKVIKHQYNFELLMCGEGSSRYKKRVKKDLRAMGIPVMMFGNVPDPFNFLGERIDFVVVPSIWEEPFGKVPVEASLNGFHVISSTSGGLKESSSLISPAPLYYEANDHDGLARRILQLLEMDRDTDKSVTVSVDLEKSLICSASEILEILKQESDLKR